MVAIFVLTVFLFILIVDFFVLKAQGKYHPAFEPQIAQLSLPLFEKASFVIPANTFLSKGHTWLQQDIDNLVLIGIDEFGSNALGNLSILSCAESEKQLKRGDLLFEGSYGNKKVKFYSPVDGEVNSINTNIINSKISDPYKTWGVKLISKDFSENRDRFFTANAAQSWMKKESIKLKSFISNHLPKVEAAGATMFDGGSLISEPAASLDELSINEFEKEFLSL